MIISVSRRTDVPAYYSQWFMQRLKAAFCEVVDPFDAKKVMRVSLLPQDVEGFVFWTKNPAPMLAHLDALEEYPYYFQCTLTGYRRSLEPGLPSKTETVIPAMQALAQRIGPERIIWRYDPVLAGKGYTPTWHEKAFTKLARELGGSVGRCIVGFYDPLASSEKRLGTLGLRVPTAEEQQETLELLANQCDKLGMQLQCCTLPQKTKGVYPACCIDAELLSRIANKPIGDGRRSTQNGPYCRCTPSLDIGSYNTCPGGCLYCYAFHGPFDASYATFENHDASALRL